MIRSGKLLFVENPRMVCGKYCDSESLDTIQFASAQTLEELTELRKTAGLPRFALKTADIFMLAADEAQGVRPRR